MHIVVAPPLLHLQTVTACVAVLEEDERRLRDPLPEPRCGRVARLLQPDLNMLVEVEQGGLVLDARVCVRDHAARHAVEALGQDALRER